MTLGEEVREQMFRSGGQSDATFSFRESLALLYRPTEGAKIKQIKSVGFTVLILFDEGVSPHFRCRSELRSVAAAA
ncbi:hypothetical protein TNCV_3502191 [Trichonephila clavipes]|uniref:Uncharacterized protein n=1 Tax=Trichonephila clavipes TaxID=2585209 RepID=A0A8X6S3R9_TRICX|nr:hypothetical protein TNCV_3502191 [Trichonephila clavipes]